MIERSRFLFALGASAVAPALLGASNASTALEPLENALVLSGGGARGAYEAGLIGCLAAIAGVSDGIPLRPYDFVCGTSIGALNGFCVATAQYSKLKELWYGISGQHVVKIKSQFAPLTDPQSGLIERAAAAVSVAGLASDERALLQNQPVFDWIVRNVDPATPLVAPLVWAVTNLTLQRPEYFYLRVKNSGQELPERVTQGLKLTLGPHTIVREATPDLLHRALFASAALPLAFDPVQMPGVDGSICSYCDGGVASNSPVGVAHAVAKKADVVLLDPPFEPETSYADAIEIALGVFGTMQRKILEGEMRAVFFQSIGKRSFDRLSPAEIARVTKDQNLMVAFMENVHATDLRYIRPEKTLPVSVGGFNDQVGIGKAYRIGWEDVGRGFQPYGWETFEL